MKLKYTSLVLVEFENSGAELVRYVSESPITPERLKNYFEDEHNADWDKDSITIIPEDKILEVSIDKPE